jgi:hypothetical protein
MGSACFLDPPFSPHSHERTACKGDVCGDHLCHTRSVYLPLPAMPKARPSKTTKKARTEKLWEIRGILDEDTAARQYLLAWKGTRRGKPYKPSWSV